MNRDLDRPVARLWRWPQSINVLLHVEYSCGHPETAGWNVAPAKSAQQARITSTLCNAGSGIPGLVNWSELPGDTVQERCFSVMAVHLFGSADMVARIVGAPLWRMVSAKVRLADDALIGSDIEIHVGPMGTAMLRVRAAGRQAWGEEQITLRSPDADPLRAMLRIGMTLDAHATQRPSRRSAQTATMPPGRPWIAPQRVAAM
jgi:hypothetical protein